MIVNNKVVGGQAGDRLYAELREYIQVSEADAPVASARQLAQKYEISVGTVRRVLLRLVEEGALYAKERSGYFVAQKPVSTKTLIYLQNWPEPERPYCARLLRGLIEEADRLGYSLEVRPYTDRSNLERAVRPGVEGVILPWAGDLATEMRERNPALRIVASVTPSRALVKGIGSVDLDWYTAGYRAASYLVNRGARNLVCVQENSLLCHGLADGLHSDPDVALRELPIPHGFSPEEAAHKLLEMAPDGVLFSDDRHAARILKKVEGLRPGWGRSVVMVSHANVGENTLPEGMALLAFDGYEVGVTLLAAMDAMIRIPQLSCCAWAVRPAFIEP